MTSSRSTRRSRGTSIVEMAIVLPLLTLLTFAILEFGIAFTRWQVVNTAAREAARFAVLFRNPCEADTVRVQSQAQAQNFATAMGVTGLSVNLSGVCQGSGTPLTATATVPFTFQAVPGISSLFGPALASSITLSATSVMRNE